MNKSNELAYTFVIFGGTGDLTHRKLMPALYNLLAEKILPENINIVSLGRRDYTSEIYQKEIYNSINKFSRIKIKEEIWSEFKNKLSYKKINFLEETSYCDLNTYLQNLESNFSISIQRIYYLAVAPDYFEPIVNNLKTSCISSSPSPRLVIEKPFGYDLKSAEYLNNKIINAFSEENTYRIDHYLGKEMLQNIMVIRFSNLVFEPIWNNKYIEQVQILSSETLGIGSRGDYYDESGAIRDMFQSHLLQLLSLIAMEPPKSLDNKLIRDEKVKVLKSLKPLTKHEIKENVVRGQYLGYRNEEKVDNNSNTETFVALRVFVDNDRWKGVPFYIRTGKKMPKKTTEIIIQFKDTEENLYKGVTPNLLVFKIQPEEGVYFQFNAKKVGSSNQIIPVKMDFCQNCQVGFNSPEAYERLLFDVMRGDSTLFARWDEVEYSWRFVDNIINEWKKENPNFPNYESGTWGPVDADNLMKKDNKVWINIEGENYNENS